MFAYRENHLPGKAQSFRYMYKLFKEIKNGNLWLDDALKAKKDLILNGIAMSTISIGMTILEDFLVMCYATSHDLRQIPIQMSAYRRAARIAENFSKIDRDDLRPYYEMLHYLTFDDLSLTALDFLTEEEKRKIAELHEQNARAFRHTFKHALRFYLSFADAHNKFKHGFMFLFDMMGDRTEDAPDWVRKLGPVIPYLATEDDLSEASCVFVGETVLDKLNMLLTGGGGVVNLLWDLTMNVTFACKCGGRKIIAIHSWGASPLSQAELNYYDQLSMRYVSKYLTTGQPNKLGLPLRTNIRKDQWMWILEDWALKD
jgi:hypothetical protein